MIRGIFQSILVLAFCLASLFLPATAGATTARGALAPSVDEENGVLSPGSEIPPFEEMAQADASTRDEVTRVAQTKSGKNDKRKQKFVDEDGDGYNDQAPETTAKGNSGTGNANAGAANDQGKNGNGPDNSQGLKKGQDKGNGQGIEGALERGIKKGQTTDKNSPATIGNGQNNSSKGNIKNNGNNRFGRNYDKYSQPSPENKGGASGRDK